MPTYNCEICNFMTESIKLFNKHNISEKHLYNIREIKKLNNEYKKIECTICNMEYKTNTYNKHLGSKLHSKNKEMKEIYGNGPFKCDICLTVFDLYGRYVRHFNSQRHINNEIGYKKHIERKERKQKFKNSTDFIYKVGDYNILLDADVYNHIVDNDINIYVLRGYACITLNRKPCLLHRYIYYHFHKKPHLLEFPYIDHRDRNPLNNKINNLRPCTHSFNARNRTKGKNRSSKYINISRAYNGSYRMNLPTKYGNFYVTYKKESHSAYHRDCIIKKLGLENEYILNNIEKPIDFVMKIKPAKKNNLPVGIRKYHNRYFSIIGGKRVSSPEIENIIEKRKEFFVQHENDIKNKIMNTPIYRNDENIAIIPIYNKKGIKFAEIKVDDEDYYDLLKYKWYVGYHNIFKQIPDSDGIYRKGYNLYIHASTNKKISILSRYIMKCDDNNKVVDHKNSNTLDNRKTNLEIVDRKQNAQNRLSVRNATSKYVGVYKNKRWYVANLSLDGKILLAKYCNSEEEAVYYRDEAAKYYNKIYNTRFKININTI